MIKSVAKVFPGIENKFEFAPFEAIIAPIIEDVLQEKQKGKFRKGTLLTPLLSVWLCFALALRRNLNCQKTLDWLLAGLRWESLSFDGKFVKDGTISRARTRMGFELFRNIFNRFTMTFKDIVSSDFHGLKTFMFDGTSLTTPDTESNREEFGKHISGRGRGAFPQIRAVALMGLVGRRIVDVAYAPCRGKKTGEKTLMFKILRRFSIRNSLLLFDAGFYSFNLVDYMHKNGFKYILKIAKSVKLEQVPGSIMADGSYMAKIVGKIVVGKNPKNGRNKWEKVEIVVRVIHFQIPGFPPVRLITNLSDPAITAKEIVIHYHRRWDIEIAFDEIKTHQCATLKGHAPTIFRSKRSDLVKQELYCILIMYNLIRTLIIKAIQTEDADPLSISFLETLDLIVQAVPLMSMMTGKTEEVHVFLLKMIANLKIDRPRRPRRNPRATKIKMSNFKRKRRKDKSETFNLEQDLEILYQKAA